MLDKSLIKNKFSKSINSYDDNAFVQKSMAKYLVSKLKNTKYENVLEIGSYTGILTKLVVSSIKFESYTALDLIDSFSYIRDLSSKIHFVRCDFDEYYSENKFDLIVSNASLQWTQDFKKMSDKIKSMLKENGSYVISVFGCQNLFEIKEAFGIGLNYPQIDSLISIFCGAEITSCIQKVKFKNSLDVLKHLKYTGVNSVSSKRFSYLEIKRGLEIIEKKFNNTLTYNPIYIINSHP